MADNKPISININIDDQNHIDQLAHSFDSLRDSINRLSNPFNSLSNNINSLNNDLSKASNTIAKLNSQNQDFVSSADKASNKMNDLSTSFSTWGNIIVLITQSLEAWQTALTGGLVIVTTFLPEIIKLATALFKGKDAIDQAKMSLETLNKGLSSSDYSKICKYKSTSYIYQ